MSVNVLGVVATAIATGGVSNWQLPGLIDGRVKCMIDKYTVVSGSEPTTGSTIKFGAQLPIGANVIAIILSASTAQASLTFTLGDAASATRYIASANSGLATAVLPVIASGQGYVVTGHVSADGDDQQIVLTTGGATMTAGVITCAVLYSLD